MSDSPATVFVDADNTLWDTDRVFADAQLALLAKIEVANSVTANVPDRLGFIRALDEAIAERHHAGLRYPPRLLVRALRLALTGTPAEQAARYVLSGHSPRMSGDVEGLAEAEFFNAVEEAPALRQGVLGGMRRLHAAGCTLLIVSEAARVRVEATAQALGLAGHFTRVIEGQKRPELFARVLRLSGSPSTAYMIGDQLDRDIAPAKHAGLATIYFPGGFKPRWTPDEAKIGPDYKIENFEEAATIILGNRLSQSDLVDGAGARKPRRVVWNSPPTARE